MRENNKIVASSYEEFVLYNRIRTNKALNLILWGCALVGPALAIGIKAGVYAFISYASAVGLSALLVVLASVHYVMCKKMPDSIWTGLFAIISLDIAIVFLIYARANITMTLFLVPLIALFFCDRKIYLITVVINYLVLMGAEWLVSDFMSSLRTDMSSSIKWFVYAVSGYAIETIILGATGYALSLEISNYFHNLYDSQKDLSDKEKKIMEQLEILNAISDIYGHISIINLKDKLITNINSTGQSLETFKIDESGIGEINKGMLPILRKEDIDNFVEFTNLNTLAERMSKRSVIYKEFDSSLIGWFRAQYIAVTGLQDQFIYTIQDIDDVKRKEESLVRISNTDELTKLLNRRAYEEELKKLRDEGMSDNLVLYYVDINGLKQVNDDLGHNAGDEIIEGTADCIRSAVGDNGKIFRTGGDEYQIIIDTDENPNDIKKRILDTVSEWSGKIVKSLAVSVGYAGVKDNPGCRIEDLEHKADEQMYLEKNKYYRNKGIDRRGQKAVYDVVCDTYTKILKVNLTNDSYQIINMPEHEKKSDKGFSGAFSTWITNFGKSGYVHHDDLAEYLESTDVDYLKKYFDDGNKRISIFYRRKYDDEFKQVMMEMMPSSEYSRDCQELFLYVKDIDR